jgi:phospholipid/cholesterol/gamma-HCH transport system ATP-binding protein
MPEDHIAGIVSELMREMNLSGLEQKMTADLSGGIQKRVGLARSLAVKPEIMLYDEPTTGVDPITGAAVDRLILKMNRTHGITSIVITHDIRSIPRIADRVAMLHEGGVRFLGTPDELTHSHDPFIQSFLEGRSDETR